MRRLPPLTAIEAFVQVARTGSIKAASQELALSPPALSRRIQALERFIGRPLFERRHQAVVLNADGDRLLQQIAPALDQLSDAVEVMTSNTDVLRLRLGHCCRFGRRNGCFRDSANCARNIPSCTSTSIPRTHLHVAAGRGARRGDRAWRATSIHRSMRKRLDRNQVYVIGARNR